jgi:FlaG/FlaF family flagellin (archaellin)
MTNESAVSPVVGTMILLTVVIILAAVVSAFAGGIAGETKAAPSAEIAVYPAGSGGDFTLVFEHRGGDAVQTGDVKINTWVRLPDGGMRAAVHSALSNTSSYGGTRLPCVWGIDGNGDPCVEGFGTAVWRPGTVAVTGNFPATAEFLGLDETELRTCVRKEAVLEVELLHLPSGTVMQKSRMLLKEG